MHPVVARLSAANRSALLRHPLYVKLQDRQGPLLDEVMKIRGSLDDDDIDNRLTKEHAADTRRLRAGLATALAVLSRHRQIAIDMIDGLALYHHGSFHDAMSDMRAARKTMDRMLRILDDLPPERDPPASARPRPSWLGDPPYPEEPDEAHPDDRPSRDSQEAGLLDWMLKDFGVKVPRGSRDAQRPTSGLALLGLLADPPASGEAMRKRLRH